ncbi:alkaline phosphatase family protein [Candidatus Poriferisodalis sp.]|uniref:alkaline phosphatase family protein n=1 Tax=Candidatus Poriferisodalis sp. TaxID=3101277 RepID=UPI003B02EC13
MKGEPLALEHTLPSYGGRCLTEVMPGILVGVPSELIDDAVANAPTVVLFVVDGLGWHQLRRHRTLAPTLAAASDASAPVTTVAPSTTATALTSLTTGATPGEHGLVGYRVPTEMGLLNTLRWRAGGQDARVAVPAAEMQPVMPFCGRPAAVVTRAEFRHSGFTAAHLRGGAIWGWSDANGLVESVRDAVGKRYPLVLAYYDNLDKIAHAFGIGAEYRSVLAEVEQLSCALRDVLPRGVPLVVTADHGVVEVLDPPIIVDPDIVALTSGWSGEARMLWLHARLGAAADLLDACERYQSAAEIAPLSRVLEERWLGRHVTEPARGRLGDVVLVPRALQAFTMPDEDVPRHPLIGRHGGLTAEEMLVPFLVL